LNFSLKLPFETFRSVKTAICDLPRKCVHVGVTYCRPKIFTETLKYRQAIVTFWMSDSPNDDDSRRYDEAGWCML